jgi:hypothetical protein
MNVLESNEGRNTSPPTMRGSQMNVLDYNDSSNALGSGSQRRLNSESNKGPSALNSRSRVPDTQDGAFGGSQTNLASLHDFASSGRVTGTRVYAAPGPPYSPDGRRSNSPGPRDLSNGGQGLPETHHDDSHPDSRDVSRGAYESSPTRDPSLGRARASGDAQATSTSQIRFPSADGRGPRRPSHNGKDYPPYLRDMSPNLDRRGTSRGRQRSTPEANSRQGLPPSGRDSSRGRKEADSSAWDSSRGRQGHLTDRPGYTATVPRNGMSPDKRDVARTGVKQGSTHEFYVFSSGKLGAAGQNMEEGINGSQSMRNLMPARGSPGPLSPMSLGSARFIF